MRSQTSAHNLRKALEPLAMVTKHSKVRPILQSVLVRAERDTLTLTATDLQVSLRMQVPANVEEEGAILLDPLPMLKLLPKEAKKKKPKSGALYSHDSQVRIETGLSGVEITHRKTMATLPPHGTADEFPSSETDALGLGTPILFSGYQLIRLSKQVAAFVSDIGPMANVHLHGDPGKRLEVVATDGKQMGIARGDRCTSEFRYNVPPFAFEVLSHIVHPLSASVLYFRDDPEALPAPYMFYTGPAAELKALLAPGRFCEYERAVPPDDGPEFLIDGDIMRQAVGRLSPFLDGENRALQLEFADGGMTLRAEGSFGKAEERMSVEGERAEAKLIVNKERMLRAMECCENGEHRAWFRVVKHASGVQMLVMRGYKDHDYHHYLMPIVTE